MNEFWNRLSERERLFVSAGAAIIGVLLLLQLVVGPAIDWRARMATQRAQAQELYKLVAAASANAGATATPGAISGEPALNAILATAASNSININFRNARPDGAVDINVSAGSDEFYQWLRALEAQHGVIAASADIAVEKGGSLRAQLVLARPASIS